MARKGVQNPLVVVIGATGTGKSQVGATKSLLRRWLILPELAVDLAKNFNGEIINGDAMQMYNGLQTITNKSTIEEQQGVPHHLLGVVEVNQQPWCMGVFKRKATSIIKEIRSRGKLPILVGGTHYYVQSLLLKEGLTGEESDCEPVDDMSRAEIGQKFPILEAPTEKILDKLRIVDPIMAGRWHPKDRRRIQRALEIYLMTGKQASKVYEEQKASTAAEKNSLLASTMILWVHADKEILRARLDARVDKMMKTGLIDEVKALDKFMYEQRAAGRAVDRSSGIWVSIGFKEFEPYLNAIKSSTSKEDIKTILASSIEKTKIATRQYAKRQIQWIRHRLMTALFEAKALDHMYLLDGSSPDEFLISVSEPATDIVRRFLAREELPAPGELSPLAADLLRSKHDVGFQERRWSWTQQPCELCGLKFTTEDAWQQHLKSRRHRMRVRKSAKMEEFNKWKARDEATVLDTEAA